MLDVCDRAVVVIGGGAVAVRKVKALLDAGAVNVTVVSPEVHADMPDAACQVLEPFRPEHLDGAELVFAATNLREVNDAVVRACRDRRIWVNRADTDDRLPGDFATPAQLRRGAVRVTVSAGSAALTAAIRDGINARWDDRWSAMADAMRDLRPLVVDADDLPPEQRSDILRLLATEPAFERLSLGGVEALRVWLIDEIEQRRRGRG